MKVRDHWAATEELWSHGSAMLTWHVVFDGRLDFLAGWLAPLLDRPYLSPVPPEWLHVTVKGIGPEDEMSPERLERLVDDAQAACALLAPIDALVGPVRVVEGGVTGDVAPAGPLRELYESLPGEGGEPLSPHVTFAYACAEAEMEPIEANASDAVTIDAVSLLRLERGDRLYRWNVLATVPLGGAA